MYMVCDGRTKTATAFADVSSAASRMKAAFIRLGTAATMAQQPTTFMAPPSSPLAALPSMDRVLQHAVDLIEAYGRDSVKQAIRDTLDHARAAGDIPALDDILQSASSALQRERRASLQRVFNLTGTVLHTNLGRAPLPEEAIRAMQDAAREPVNLEYDLEDGRRGERDEHIESLLCRLTGAEAATAVNNNAAAVLLAFNTLALRREVPVSRGELVEIGGAFRLPEIMARAGCRLREVGTTNRTHLRDYAEAIGPKTGMVFKAHASNYSIEGFTAAVPQAELAALCKAREVPFVVDLGSGSLIDMALYSLPQEPMVQQAIANGADLVTFSGDKLLGGPQAGIVVGRKALVQKLRRNPLKRALRLDKVTLAALAAVLRLYLHPETLRERLPVLRLLTRPLAELRAMAERLRMPVQAALRLEVQVADCQSQVGSGAAPRERIASVGLAIRPADQRLAARLRALPIPVLGHLQDGALVLDLRCLEDEAAFLAQLRAP
jgi:L-seryl-tRNA(Ser) seleniumtransferase